MRKLLAVVFSCVALSACAPNYSDGQRVGVVTKLSHKGIVFKSWEGMLNQGGFRNSTDDNGNTTVVANVLEFNVQDPKVVQDLQTAMETGQRVRLTYNQWLVSPFTIENSYVINKVEFLK